MKHNSYVMKLPKKSAIAFFTAIFMLPVYFYIYHYIINDTSTQSKISRSLNSKHFVLLTEGCRITRLDPFDSTIKKFYEETSGDIKCPGKRYLNIENNTVVLDEAKVMLDYPLGNFSCMYKPILRNPKNVTKNADRVFEYGDKRLLKYGVVIEEEYIKVVCKYNGKVVHEEFLASTPLKPQIEDRCEKAAIKHRKFPQLNVIVVGIDSISKLNFQRHFKLTAEYLKQNLSAFEFNGYVKVGDNTFPNLTPMLTGHFVQHYYNSTVKDRYFDDLDFIWKNFSSIGYRTFLAEDAPYIATYNYEKNGFQFPPTNYFFRPLTLAIENSPYQSQSKYHCFQGKSEIRAVFDYLRSFLATMEARPLFAFTWVARLTHDQLNKAGYADKPTFELLRDIHDMGLLNSSVLLFVSDHGIRFGGIRKTYIGKIEERMPFAFVSLPESFLKSNPDVAKNLNINQQRLVTPFDVHEMFVDLYKRASGEPYNDTGAYGISLFKEIPITRTCKDANILPHWCPCHVHHQAKVNDIRVINASKILVQTINMWTEPYRKICEKLEVETILDARMSLPDTALLRYSARSQVLGEDTAIFGEAVDAPLDILLTVLVSPSCALFESTLRYENAAATVLDDVSRVNKYGNQSYCINDSFLKKFCFCSIPMQDVDIEILDMKAVLNKTLLN